MIDFVHLHCHSAYSLLSGASRLPDILARAKQCDMTALALTDTNGLYGAMSFYRQARQAGIKPIFGAIIETERNFSAEGAGGEKQRAVCLARNRDGYAALCRIITERHLCEDFDLVEALTRHQDGIYILADSPALLHQLAPRVEPGRLFAEVRRFPGGRNAIRVTGLRTLRAAEELRLPRVATNAVHFVDSDSHPIHCVLTAIRRNILLSEVLPQDTAHPEARLKSGTEMERLFADIPDAIANTRRIAEDCNVEFDGRPVFPKCELERGETPFSRLWKLAFHGAEKRYQPLTPPVIERLRHELEVINALGFAEYFLIVHDIVRHARGEGIPIVGRGSAADSLVAYCLGITCVDPLAHDLYFERFLNMHRTDCPDIDLDICWKRRDEVLDYVYQRYGAGNVAMVANHNTFQARSAFRDVARVMGLPLDEINDLCKMLPYHSVKSIRDAMQAFPETRGFPIDQEPYRTIVGLAEAIDGFPRHLSIHVGGIVIGDRPLTHYAPLERSTKGLVICQYEKDGIEDIGLIKIDLLGQRSLSLITDTVKAVKKNYGREIDVHRLPDGDPKTADLIRRGRTMGCFQIESPGMRSLLKQMRARNRHDLIIGLSLIRPGPAGSGMKEHFILRRLGKERPTHLHPKLESVLGSTHGIMLYQEDILRVAHAVAGFSLDDADELRKAISKERSKKRMTQLRERFIRGAVRNGGRRDQAETLWTLVSNFAAYSYCKAHATTYGYISYQACWLKAHYPAEFLAAVMTNLSGYYEPRVYLEEARRLGNPALPPCVNRSTVEHKVELPAGKPAIRVGLMSIKGLSRRAMRAIMEARRQLPFASLDDFLARVKVTRPEAETLALCGAFDCFGDTRPTTLWKVHLLVGSASTRKNNTPLAEMLFAGVGCVETRAGGDSAARNQQPGSRKPSSRHPAVPRLPDYTPEDKLKLEQELLGLTVSDHPLAPYEDALKRYSPIPAGTLDRYAGRRVTVAGWLVTMRRAVTRKQEYMKFVTLEDRTGMVEAVLFPDTYQKYGHLFGTYGPYIIHGTVENHHGSCALTAERVELLP